MEKPTTTPLCVFCGAPWGEPEMRDLYHSEGCETCGYGSETEATIEIHCSECHRLVYQKDVKSS